MFGRNRNRKKEKIELNKDSYKKALKIFSYIKPYRFTFFIGFIFLILSSTASVVFPLLMGELFGNNSADSTQQSLGGSFVIGDNLNQIALSLFIIFGAQAIFSFFRIVLFSKVTESALADLRQDSYKHILSLPIDFFNQSKVGELTSRIASDITLLQETFNTTIAEFIRQLFIVTGGFIFLALISPKLLGIMVASVPVMAIIAVVFGRFIKNISKEAQEKAANSVSIIEETLNGISIVKAFTNEKLEFLRYKKATDDVKKLSIKNARFRGAFVSFLIFFMFGAIVFIIFKGLEMKNAGEIQDADFYSFLFYTVFIGASIGSLPDLYAKIQKAIGSTEHLMNLLEIEKENIDLDIKASTVKINGEIEFNDVSFFYKSRPDVQVLKDINLNINKGETIALVGPSGAGKSTLASLLMRFYDTTSGSILIDNKTIEDYTLKDLRSNIALVPQEVILFSGTIKENILYGNQNATEEEIIEVAKKANAYSFISNFPDGFDTVVGDKGIQLSGGQRQRVAIARAMLNNPSILLLDEATSALDSESEKLVQQALDELMKGRTSLVIAHRLSTIRKADKIVVIDQGQVAETGTHAELIQKEGGIYAKLSKMQFQLNEV